MWGNLEMPIYALTHLKGWVNFTALDKAWFYGDSVICRLFKCLLQNECPSNRFRNHQSMVGILAYGNERSGWKAPWIGWICLRRVIVDALPIPQNVRLMDGFNRIKVTLLDVAERLLNGCPALLRLWQVPPAYYWIRLRFFSRVQTVYAIVPLLCLVWVINETRVCLKKWGYETCLFDVLEELLEGKWLCGRRGH